MVMPQLLVQVIQMCPYTPLWKRGARGDFISIILKSPFIPLCQRGIKTPVTEGLHLILKIHCILNKGLL